MSRNCSNYQASMACWPAFAVALVAVLLSSATAFAQTPLPNGSFEDDVVTSGNMLEQVPTDWRLTWSTTTPNIYRPGASDPFYGELPDGDQALYYTDSAGQEVSPGATAAIATGITMQSGVDIRILFDAVYFDDQVTGWQGMQFTSYGTADPNIQFFMPNIASEGFSTFAYEYTPSLADNGKNFAFGCYSTSNMSAFLVDNFRYETFSKPPKPGPVAGGPVVDGGTTPYAWYRADVGVTPYLEDENRVAWWQDQSGNSRHVEAFGNPQITNNGPAGAQTITFDGADDCFLGAEAEWGTAAAGTVFAVWERSSDSTVGIDYIYDSDIDMQREVLSAQTFSGGATNLTGGGTVNDGGGWTNHLFYDVEAPGAGEYVVTSMSHTTGTTDTFNINGWNAYQGDLLSGGMSGLKIGSYVTDQYYHHGDIAELIFFEGELSDTERAAIEDELMSRWGVEAWDWMPGDANKDGVVDADDAATLASNWLATGVGWAEGDFNDDGIVNDIDATIMATNWQGAAGTSVPEPSTLVLLAGMAMLLIWRRKR